MEEPPISTTSLIIICSQPENFALPAIPKYSSEIVLKDAIDKGTQISKLRRENKNELAQMLFMLIMDIKNWFKTKRGMETQADIGQAVLVIIRRFYYLKIEEIAFAFHNAKAGLYIDVLDRFDGDSIIQILKAYENNDRNSYLANTHMAYKGTGTSEVAKTLQSKMEELQKKDPKEIKAERKKFYDDYLKAEAEKKAKEKETKEKTDEVRKQWAESRKKEGNK